MIAYLTDLAAAYRALWQHHRGDFLLIPMIPAALFVAALAGEVVR